MLSDHVPIMRMEVPPMRNPVPINLNRFLVNSRRLPLAGTQREMT